MYKSVHNIKYGYCEGVNYHCIIIWRMWLVAGNSNLLPSFSLKLLFSILLIIQ